jgi:hypothetical protein
MAKSVAPFLIQTAALAHRSLWSFLGFLQLTVVPPRWSDFIVGKSVPSFLIQTAHTHTFHRFLLWFLSRSVVPPPSADFIV